MRRRFLFAYAMVGAPTLFALFIYFCYWLAALDAAAFPFAGTDEWRWDVAFTLALGSRIAAVFNGLAASQPNWRRRALPCLVYALLMATILKVIFLLIACAHGDCI